jgi:Peptidase family M1 domain
MLARRSAYAPAMRRAALCLLLVAALLVGALPAAAAPPVDPPHYDLRAAVDYDAAIVQTTQHVRFVDTYGVPLDSIVFHSMAGAFGALHVDSAQVNGQAVAPAFDASGSVIELPLPSPLAPGAAADVELDWQLQVPSTPNRLSASDRLLSLGNWFPTLAVHHGDWDRRPYQEIGDAFFTETADFDVELDVSRPVTVAYTGDLVQQTSNRWQLTARGVRDFAVTMSPAYAELDGKAEGGPDISVYTLDAKDGQAFLDAARAFAEQYQALVGPYPYRTLRVAESALPPQWAGMEYPELVFISTGVAPHGPAAIRSVVAHEVAHQWFYGLLGDDQLAEPWLDEGFATYLPLAANEMLPGDLTAASGLAAPGPGPAIDQPIEAFSSDGAYATAVYARGGRFLAELRAAMGDANWSAFLHALYQTYLGKIETSGAVLDLAEQAAPSVNLNPLIAQYTANRAFSSPQEMRWTLDEPQSPWVGQVIVNLGAEFPITSVELWLDDRQVATGTGPGSLTVDAASVPAGDYVLLARVTDDQGAVHERATRVRVAE